jgi:cyclopropane fatty-acyl-phospholipid synthase-like methyltransferase
VTTEQTSAESVGGFYDLWETYFAGVIGESLHMGYWRDDADRSSLNEAEDQLTDLVGGPLPLAAGHHLLDVGCGTGAPAVRLAGRTGCRITGVTISDRQLAAARSRAADCGVCGRVAFQKADATALPFPDGSFDSAMAIESLIHMDAGRALGEVHRVLKSGGLLSIADYVEKAPAGGAGEDSLSPSAAFQHGRAASLEELSALVRNAGFTVVSTADLTAQVVRSHDESLKAILARRAELVGTPGESFADQVAKSFPLRAQEWRARQGYAMLVARK